MKIHFVHPFKFVLFHIYLLQLEEYDISRFLMGIKKTRGIPIATQRKPLVWTAKVMTLVCLALLLQFVFSLLISRTLFPHNETATLSMAFFLWLVSSYIFFVFLTLAMIILLPFDHIAKEFIVRKARQKIRRLKQLKVVGIAGSYGKTTMKEAVASVLSLHYRVVKTPENINTPIGISRVILRSVTEDTEYLVVEMGEYIPGDIATICSIVPPDIAVITGINEAHLERMGSLANTTRAIFEICENAKDNAAIILNADDERVRIGEKEFLKGKRRLWYSAGNHPASCTVSQEKFLGETGYSCRMKTAHAAYDLHIKLLGHYAIGVAMACIIIGEETGIPKDKIVQAIASITPNPHRLQPIHNGVSNILVIDDSYNGNPEGVTEAIGVLSRFGTRRKVYITPGLVEMGQKSKDVHHTIGNQLSGVADIVVLISTSVTPDIRRGLLDGKFDKKNIVSFPDALTMQKEIGKILSPNDVVLFQNDWPDNYK